MIGQASFDQIELEKRRELLGNEKFQHIHDRNLARYRNRPARAIHATIFDCDAVIRRENKIEEDPELSDGEMKRLLRDHHVDGAILKHLADERARGERSRGTRNKRKGQGKKKPAPIPSYQRYGEY